MQSRLAPLHPPSQRRRHALLVAAVLCGATALSQAGLPYPSAATPKAQDMGVLAPAARQVPMTVSVLLKLRDSDQLEALVTAQHTPGSASYRQFLSSAQFAQRFAPAAAAVSAASAHFAGFGLSTHLESGRVLKVTGSTAALEAAFQTRLHDFAVASNGATPGYHFRAPDAEPRIASAAVADSVQGIFGLDTRPAFRPLLRKAVRQPLAVRSAAAGTTSTPDSPGFWTVADFAAYYNVTAAYAKGLSGAGRTLGIVTLASFTPSDAFTYWAGVGLSVDPARISIVDVDGGPGAPSDASGSDETTLDVEQSGGLAPNAKIIVYQAPNTDQGFVDVFAHAIGDNTVDSFSSSWGEWEYFETQATVQQGPRSKTALDAFSSLFLQAAAQGQSGFIASGDGGAYEANRFNLPPSYSETLSVSAPGAAAWITAAGGTTLPGAQDYGGGFVITIPTEQGWGWSYLHGLCVALGYDDISCGIFPVGSGGGVSSYTKLPVYQAGVPGMRVTEAGQTFTDYTVSPPQDIVTLPAGFAGRNTPDVSANADPQTGYTIYYTSDQGGSPNIIFAGGTSFVAPQFAGLGALAAEAMNGRVGLWNFPLYRWVRTGLGYKGQTPPLRDITAGDNWFYDGIPGYDQVTGVGVLDVGNFIDRLTRGQ